VSEGTKHWDGGHTLEIVDRAVFDLWSVANQLAQIRPPQDRFRVTVFGSARVAAGDPVYDQVRRLAARLSWLGCDIITGGGPGLMQAANEGATEGDPDDQTRSVGIRVSLSHERETNPFVEEVYHHRSFFSRLHHFVRISNAYVVMPGGIGTTLELMMVWQLLQVKHLDEIPLVLVGEMWQDLVDWVDRRMSEDDIKFVSPGDAKIPLMVDTADQAAEVLEPYVARFISTPGK
jgi:uncharacterized protein (TIGR00730 family)